jgi:DNA polymerase
MYDVVLAQRHDLADFRDMARRLVAAAIAPEQVFWHESDGGLFTGAALPQGPPLRVPGAFTDLASDVICHSAPERHALLYQVLWRLTRGERQLLTVPADPLVHRLHQMQKAVRREVHRMHAFVRFRELTTDGGEYLVAWFEPEHFIVPRAAPFFVDRFANMRWSLLTPLGSAHWNGTELSFGGPVPRDQAPARDHLDEWWRTYYRAAFNPARSNPRALQSHMPKRYWRNLPEARVIEELLSAAPVRTGAMIDAAPTIPNRRSRPPAPTTAVVPVGNLTALAQQAAACRRCPLHAAATQTVFGAGPQTARLMLVGEQPGDQEDLAGQPFVGPAGQLLDRALVSAGIDRSRTYLTNAVKHFKFEPRGKRRIHNSPGRAEVEACSWWLERELALVRPDVVVALGATAAQALLGRKVRVLAERGTLVRHPAGFDVLITVHPSFLLRLNDSEAEEREFAALAHDLRSAGAALARGGALPDGAGVPSRPSADEQRPARWT